MPPLFCFIFRKNFLRQINRGLIFFLPVGPSGTTINSSSRINLLCFFNFVQEPSATSSSRQFSIIILETSGRILCHKLFPWPQRCGGIFCEIPNIIQVAASSRVGASCLVRACGVRLLLPRVCRTLCVIFLSLPRACGISLFLPLACCAVYWSFLLVASLP